MAASVNDDITGQLEEVAGILSEQVANRFRWAQRKRGFYRHKRLRQKNVGKKMSKESFSCLHLFAWI